MSYSCAYDSKKNRPIGYGVVAICDHPGCKKVIDRGIGFLCCENPNHTASCGGFFCEDHRNQYIFQDELLDMTADELSALYLTGDEQAHDEFDGIIKCMHPPIEHKEHPLMFNMMENDESWSKWRELNPGKVEELRKKVITDYKE